MGICSRSEAHESQRDRDDIDADVLVVDLARRHSRKCR